MTTTEQTGKREQLEALIAEFPGLSLDAIQLVAEIDDHIASHRVQQAQNEALLVIPGPTDDYIRRNAHEERTRAEALEAVRQQFAAHRRVVEFFNDNPEFTV